MDQPQRRPETSENMSRDPDRQIHTNVLFVDRTLRINTGLNAPVQHQPADEVESITISVIHPTEEASHQPMPCLDEEAKKAVGKAIDKIKSFQELVDIDFCEYRLETDGEGEVYQHFTTSSPEEFLDVYNNNLELPKWPSITTVRSPAMIPFFAMFLGSVRTIHMSVVPPGDYTLSLPPTGRAEHCAQFRWLTVDIPLSLIMTPFEVVYGPGRDDELEDFSWDPRVWYVRQLMFLSKNIETLTVRLVERRLVHCGKVLSFHRLKDVIYRCPPTTVIELPEGLVANFASHTPTRGIIEVTDATDALNALTSALVTKADPTDFNWQEVTISYQN